ATVKVDPLGRVIAILGTTPQGQGHQTVVSQIVADELGLKPQDVTVVDEMDTFTRVWSISSGTYSSRFGSVGTSAAALAARKLRAKLVEYAAHLMDVPGNDVEFKDGAVRMKTGKGPSYTVKDLAGRAHWNTESLPDGMEPGLQATAVFGFTVAKAVDAEDRVNSSNTYGFIAEVMAVEVDPDTAQITIVRYVTVHDAGTIINPMIVEGQIYGGALHGLGGARSARRGRRRTRETTEVRLSRAEDGGRGAGVAHPLRRRGEDPGRRPEPDAAAQLPPEPAGSTGRPQPDPDPGLYKGSGRKCQIRRHDPPARDRVLPRRVQSP